MQLVTNLFPFLLLICLPSFLPVTLPPPVILPSPSLAAVIIVSACAWISFSTLKSTADNEVVITRPPPSATSNSSATSVIIFGWGGARRRHLRRLEEWYQSKGIVTMAYTAPFSVFFYSCDSKQLRELAAAALEQASLGQRIIVHLHSNTGAFTFAAFLSVCPAFRPAAVVWDSAPSWSPALEPSLLKFQSSGGALQRLKQLVPIAGTKAMQLLIAPYLAVPMMPSLLQTSAIMHPLYTPALAVGNIVMQLLFICLEIVGVVPRFTLYACVRLVLRCCKGAAGPAHTAGPSAAGGCSVLNVFVASRADSLISFSKVCSYASAIAGAVVTPTPASLQLQLPRSGCAVVDFGQTPHVAHFLKKGDEYKHLLLQLVG